MRILAVHPGALGDVILFGRLCEMLGGDVTLVAGGANGKLLAGLGVVSKCLDYDGLPMHEVFGDTPLDKCRLPGLLGDHDRLISCLGGGDRRAELRLAACCGADNAAFLPVRPEARCSRHLLEVWAEMLGLPVPSLSPAAWAVPDEWRRHARKELQTRGICGKLTVIHPGSGGEAKCWPVERFCELARQLREDGRNVLMAIGPAEVERWGEPQIQSLRGRFPVLACPQLPLLAGVLAEADAYAGNDSGVTHLAAVVGAKTVAIFGPSRAEHFSPLGPKVHVIRAKQLTELDAEFVLQTVTDRG